VLCVLPQITKEGGGKQKGDWKPAQD